MPISYRIDGAEGFVRLLLEGIVTVPEILETFDLVLADPAHRAGMPIYGDCRTLEPRFSVEDLRLVASGMSSRRERIGICRTAVAVSSDVLFGLARMYEVFSQSTSMEFRVFRAPREALSWIAGGDP